MREFEYRKKVRRILFSPFVLLPFALIFVFLVRGAWGVYLKSRDSGAELRLAKDRLVRLQERQVRLSDAARRLETEEGIEGEIRDRFQMAKEEEREIIIVDAENRQNPVVAPKITFLQKILDFFTIR